MNLCPQHEVAFPVHHQLLVNLVEFEFFVSVVVSTLDAHVLVLVLVHRVSSVVLCLGEIVVVVDRCVIVVLMVATKTVVAHVFLRRRLCRSLLLCQILLSGYTMYGALIGIVFSDSHQHLSHFSLCG